MKKIAIVLISLFFLFPLRSFACSCVHPDSPEKELQQADAVFSGEVIKIEDNIGSKESITIKVKEIWKGIEENYVVVKTADHSASCGYEFEKNEEYIIYAQKQGNELYVSLCSRTNILSEAEEDLSALGKGEPPSKIVNPPESEFVETLKGWGLAIFILTILIGLYYFVRETNK